MDCQSLDRLIFSYCDNNLTPKKRLAVEEHLQKCFSCRHKLDLVILENELIKEAADIPQLSESFTGDLMMLIESRYGSTAPRDDNKDLPASIQGKKKANWGIMRSRIAIAAVFLLVFLGASFYLESGLIDIADKTNPNTPLVPITLKQDTPKESILSGQGKSNKSVIKSELKEDVAKSPEHSNVQEIKTTQSQFDTSSEQNGQLSAHSTTTQTRLADNRGLQEANRGKLSTSSVYDEETNMLLPSGLPESYQLIGASQGTEDYSFSYKKIDNGVELKITVTPKPKQDSSQDIPALEPEKQDIDVPQSTNSKMFSENLSNYSKTDMEDLSIDEMSKEKNSEAQQQFNNPSPATTASPASTEMLNSIKETLLINKHEYQVTFSGNLPPEELATVAAVIDWQESKLATEPIFPQE